MIPKGAGRATLPPARRLVLLRAPLMAAAMLSLVCGTWLGLVRIGWTLPLLSPSEIGTHGPLMVCGFLGTLVSLERAVALESPWAYAAPALVAAGALSLGLSAGPFGPLLIAAGSVVLLAVFAVLLRRQPALYMTTMASGAGAWAVGNALWLGGAPVFRVVYWWIAFLVLTIAGERLELNRVLRPSRGIRAAFGAAVTLVLLVVVVTWRFPQPGIHALGAGLLVLAAWLVRHDVARRTVRQQGLTRYMAVSLLAGYAWLGFGGLVALTTGVASPGLVYDATLHAIFLGFVMSMVFAHVPVIVPAVIGRPLPFYPRFYWHAAVLHASVLVRVAGDLVGGLVSWRAWGGLLNAVALALFVVNVGRSLIAGRRPLVAHGADRGDEPLVAPAQRRTRVRGAEWTS
jgi:hypothetical protein